MLNTGIGLMVIGIVALCIAILALLCDQPYHVWWPFVIVGFLLTIMIPFLYRNIKKTYTDAELKKISVDDI